MYPSVVAVFKKKNPLRREGIVDSMLWHRDIGFLIEVKNLKRTKTLHGLVAWAEGEKPGRRYEVRFDQDAGEFIFVEQFNARRAIVRKENMQRKPWGSIKSKVHTSGDRGDEYNERAYRLLRPSMA